MKTNKQVKQEKDVKLPLRTQFAFTTGTLGSSLMSGTVYAAITIFYNTKLLLSDNLLGLAWLIFMVWNTLNDPLFGWISDNTRSKLGRRIPYLRYGAFFYGLSYIFCWFPIAKIGDQWGLFWNFLLVLFVFDTMFSIIGAVYYCLPNEMTIKAEERGQLGFLASFSSIASIGLQFGITIFFLADQSPTINPLFYPVMIVVGILSSSLVFITSFYLKENKFAQLQTTESFLQGFKETLKNKPFFIFEITNFSLTLLVTVISTGIFYYIKYVLAINMNLMLSDWSYRQDVRIGLIFLVAGLIMGAIFSLKKIPVWHPKKVGLISFIIITVGFVSFFFTGKNMSLSIAPWVILAFGTAGTMISLPAITGDVIDYDEIIIGKRREGYYAGFNAIITKPAISLANWAFLKIILVFGFVNSSITQTSQAQTGIIFALTIIPAIFTFISVIALKFYPLDGEWWKRKKIEIKLLHEKKQKEFEEKYGSK